MNTDTREWWAVQDGQIRFSIDGQAPFVASKGYLVQVPYRTFYTMETVGDRSSLRLEVNIAKARKMYPLNTTPIPEPGVEYVRARVAGKGTYEGGNKPYVDFNAVVAGTDRTRQFVNDARAVANIILGRGIPPPPPSDKGHFHTESSEFWFILLGQIRYTIEGLPTFVADQGDIVYVPKQRWHLASLAGDGMSARLAMNGYPDLAHSFERALTMPAAADVIRATVHNHVDNQMRGASLANHRHRRSGRSRAVLPAACRGATSRSALATPLSLRRPPGKPPLRTCRRRSRGSRLVPQSLLVLQVRALTGGQVTIEFFHVFEDRHARQRLHDLEYFLDLRLHVDE